MDKPRLNPIIRLLPSLTDVAFLMPLVFLFARLDGVKTMLGDGDTGWHIRTGEWILANHRVPTEDMFSYTKPGQPWFAWEWLWDILFAWLHQKAGLAAVVLASIAIICLTTAFLYQVVRRRCSNPIIAIAVTIAACAGSSLHWLARPHLFTMLFLVIFLAILDRVEHEQRFELLRWLPILSILWTNLHGGFLLGILILLSYIGGEVAAAILTPSAEVRGNALHRAKLYAFTALGCGLASLVNPYGWGLHRHLYEYLTDPFQFKFITEFFSFNFHHPMANWVEAVLWASIIVSVRYAARGRYQPLCLVAGMSHIALFSARNIPLFMIAVSPIVASGLEELVQLLSEAPVVNWLKRGVANFQEIASEVAAIDVHWRLYPLSIFSILVLGLLFAGAPEDSKKLKAEYDPKRYPAKAIEMILANQVGDRIFTDDEWGDYLIYRMYPRRRVFVDGRSDFYGGTFDEKFIDALNVKYGWEEYLQQYKVDTILLSTTSPLAGAIKESRNWKPIYDDTIAIVFRPTNRADSGKPAPQHQQADAGGAKTLNKSGTETTAAAGKQDGES